MQRYKAAAGTYVAPGPPDYFLELLTFAAAVLVQFLKVLYVLTGLGRRLVLEVGSFSEKLLGGDLRSVEQRGESE